MQPGSGRGFSRRQFLGFLGTAAAGVHTRARCGAMEGQIMTVLGPIAATALGQALAHEHAVVDFIGAEKAEGLRYDEDDAFRTVLPHLERVRKLGCRALVECTPNYIGRNVRLLRRLSEASGMHLVTNTGYYGAAANKFLPRHTHSDSTEELAARWVREWREGIAGTKIRPGFVKLGVDKGKLSGLHEKLVRAGARTHLETGLTVAIHTGDGEAALDELRVLGEEGVKPSALVWVHAQNASSATQLQAARRGAWVSLDGYGAKHHQRYKDFLAAFKREGLLERVLLSHDHFWRIEGEEAKGSLKLSAGGETEPFQALFTRLLPDLRESGFTKAEVDQLLVVNPREALMIRVRAA